MRLWTSKPMVPYASPPVRGDVRATRHLRIHDRGAAGLVAGAAGYVVELTVDIRDGLPATRSPRSPCPDETEPIGSASQWSPFHTQYQSDDRRCSLTLGAASRPWLLDKNFHFRRARGERLAVRS